MTKTVTLNYGSVAAPGNTFNNRISADSDTFARNDIDALGNALDLHTHANGLGLPVNTIPSGGLTITAGGLTVTAGGITLNGGNLMLSATSSIQGGAGTLAINAATGQFIALQFNAVTQFSVRSTGSRFDVLPAFVASDHYLVADSNGNVHVSAIGPAS